MHLFDIIAIKRMAQQSKVCSQQHILCAVYIGIKALECQVKVIECIVISVNHQLVFYRKYDGGFIQEVHKPKTESGVRYVPMSDEVVQCFKYVIAARVHLDKEPVIDGYTNFIFITRNGVKSKYNLGPALTRIMKTYNEKFQDKEPLPNLTPHIFRHTFCTELINKGMNLKSVQYVMGHASIETTLNIYTHVNKMDVFEEFAKTSGKPATNNCVYLGHAV